MPEAAADPSPTQPEPARPRGLGAWIVHLYRRLFTDHWEALNREAEEERRPLGGRFDGRALWIKILVALILVFQEYWGDRPTWHKLVPRFPAHWMGLGEFAWWSGTKVLGYLIVPAIALRLAGFSLAEAGFRLRGMTRHLWIYVVLYLAILPVIVIASYTKAFQDTYPFYKLCARSWADLVAWELLYAVSFLALEFFFRGFMLFGLRRTFGAYAIFVMIVPYCMIHFHKPVAEVTGAIFAGVILGTLALRTRSIWCGVLIHVSVAITMDLLAIHHTTGYPGSGRFVGS